MSYFAAQLRGNDPAGIEMLCKFDSESVRDEWVSHGAEEDLLRTPITTMLWLASMQVNASYVVRWVSNKNWMNNLTAMAGGWKYELEYMPNMKEAK